MFYKAAKNGVALAGLGVALGAICAGRRALKAIDRRLARLG
jgi:hypothetical protein